MCGAARGRRRVFRAGSTASARSPPSGTLHQRTVDWGPFNHQLNARVLRDEITLAVGLGQRFTFGPNGALSASELDVDGRLRFLVEELGISEAVALRVPDDRPSPRRADPAAR